MHKLPLYLLCALLDLSWTIVRDGKRFRYMHPLYDFPGGMGGAFPGGMMMPCHAAGGGGGEGMRGMSVGTP